MGRASVTEISAFLSHMWKQGLPTNCLMTFLKTSEIAYGKGSSAPLPITTRKNVKACSGQAKIYVQQC